MERKVKRGTIVLQEKISPECFYKKELQEKNSSGPAKDGVIVIQ